MPVHEPLGLVLLQQVVEAGKALVGPVIAIVQAGRRGMGQQQVDAARPVGLEPEPPHPAAHFLLRVLEGLLTVVADAAAQPHDAQPFPDIHLIVHTDAAARLALCAVAAIVVAVDIQNGGRCKICYIFEVFFWQIPAGEDQIDPGQAFPGAIVPQRLGGGIGNCKYLHVRNTPFC